MQIGLDERLETRYAGAIQKSSIKCHVPIDALRLGVLLRDW
jgi:hypothetical protein